MADDDECQRFRKDTQLTAVILLTMRSSSLLSSLLVLLETGTSQDGFHLVLRGLEETWYLAHEFRLRSSSGRAARWLARQNDSWTAKINDLAQFALGRGHHCPNFGRDYGSLSELAHPTRVAAENSVTLCGVRLGIDGAEKEIANEEENCGTRISYALYQLLWLVLDQDTAFISVPIIEKNMPVALNFVNSYPQIDPGT